MRREVWLRSNVRPAGMLLGLTTLVVAAALAAAVLAAVPAWLLAVVGAVGAVLVGAAGCGLWVAWQPRLARRGDVLEARLWPRRAERVPLEIVECVFRGTEPLGRSDPEGTRPRFRVGTIVVRLAERAVGWRARETFRPWGTWQDGHLVIDGRWCEPLSAETVGGLAAKLVQAKRELAAGGRS